MAPPRVAAAVQSVVEKDGTNRDQDFGAVSPEKRGWVGGRELEIDDIMSDS
jgi:hypothetical protein